MFSGVALGDAAGQPVWPYLPIHETGKFSLKLTTERTCNIRKTYILLEKTILWEFSIFWKEGMCPEFDKNRLLWLFHYSSYMDLPYNWRSVQIRLSFFCYVAYVVDFLFGFLCPKIRGFKVLAHPEWWKSNASEKPSDVRNRNQTKCGP